ncbi:MULTISPECIES: TraV family lipoprotein [Sphingomonadaceae]|jgi:conjugal transfer pilus assembly protein TraV|uniref:TraV family lipoprotein n=3 Tax=Alphaproteobacteria TaxID=28211 RepID=A0A7X4GJS9_9SPHN|nr:MULTISPECIES: TraV family lipoprotein [Sphingomonadaceae]ATP22037.1 hypothetical protein BV87_26710 [Sphingobium yanoikuyae]MBU67470.1 conjugal transfer protein TraV [Cupriavidus sp.]MCC4253841.1 TraV family lipoprotein [Sphingobium naphthae]MDG5973081.1 TraV family lipoprotein [Sphingomonas paucimobilis]MEA3482062.1 TraV family lipoprotein [Pseudomonadota bacterium]OJY53938.1 MAG: hypothetical protein BGP17_15760 [Sphingomonas sp. 67-41]|tara:strand:+ start:442 stop:1377 length:936 start_codon:yes stop_codon:yes gene_type:complete
MIGKPIRRRAGSAPTLLAFFALGGCASLGGNIAGSFSCPAPDGVCAPASAIDDRALAMISGEEGDRFIPAGADAAPAGNVSARQISRTALATSNAGVSPVGAPRTSEKVLRIVFQPYVDERGRLHEASAIHAVVQQGEWQEQARQDAAILPPTGLAATGAGGESISDALARDDAAPVGAILPDPAAVAAARARVANPIDGIKADVAQRLHADRPRPTSPQAVSKTVGITKQDGTAQPERAAGSIGSNAVQKPVSAEKAEAGRAATDQIKASEPYQRSTGTIESTARAAASGAVTGASVKAESFPATVPEHD